MHTSAFDCLEFVVARNSIGHTGAAQLLLTAGDNPERLRSEASFASSGKTVRYRLNRGGDCGANSALHIIAIGRLRTDQRTKDYVARRLAEGHSKLDAIRALKRYLPREVFTLITQRRKQLTPRANRRAMLAGCLSVRSTRVGGPLSETRSWLPIGRLRFDGTSRSI